MRVKTRGAEVVFIMRKRDIDLFGGGLVESEVDPPFLALSPVTYRKSLGCYIIVLFSFQLLLYIFLDNFY